MNTPSSLLHVREVIDDRPLSRMQILVITLCMCTAVLDGFDTQVIGMLAPAMSRELGVPLTHFGPIFSAGLVGMLVGAVTLGPLADRYGRKRMIVGASIVFGLLSFATAFAQTFDQVLICRLITGIGLGGSLPNAVSLGSEYAPKRYSRTVVTSLMCGVPLGAVVGGMISTIVIPIHGWQGVFMVGGALPLVTALLSAIYMKESPRFLALRDDRRGHLEQIIRRIAPDLDPARVQGQSAELIRRIPLGELFKNGRGLQTALLWIPNCLNLVVLYFIVSWLPALLAGAHQSVDMGIRAISVFSLGGVVGCAMQGPVMNWFGKRRTLLCELAIYMLVAVVVANFAGNAELVIALSFVIGVVVQGTQAGLIALAAESYPIYMRATGVGCAVAIGRIGSISGPLIGGLLLQMHWPISAVFMAGIVPALVAAAAIAVMGILRVDSRSGVEAQ